MRWSALSMFSHRVSQVLANSWDFPCVQRKVRVSWTTAWVQPQVEHFEERVLCQFSLEFL